MGSFLDCTQEIRKKQKGSSGKAHQNKEKLEKNKDEGMMIKLNVRTREGWILRTLDEHVQRVMEEETSPSDVANILTTKGLGSFKPIEGFYFKDGRLSGYWEGICALDDKARESTVRLYDALIRKGNQITSGPLNLSEAESLPKTITDYNAGIHYMFGLLRGEEFPGIYRRMIHYKTDTPVRVIKWQQ